MHNEDRIQIFRELLKYNGLDEIEGRSSDEELSTLLGTMVVPASMSVTTVKKILFSYVFLNKDNKEINKTIAFFQEQLKVKQALNMTTKRMIIFFLKNKMFKDTRRAYNTFLKTYGISSSTFHSKQKNPFDFLNFSRLYNDTLKPLISSLKKPNTKKFNGLKTTQED